MGNTFNPKDTFLDVPLTTYRDTLRRWTYHQDLRQVLANRKIALAPQAAAVLVNEADLAGFVQASNDFRNRLTDKGRDFINASPLKSMRREKSLGNRFGNPGELRHNQQSRRSLFSD